MTTPEENVFKFRKPSGEKSRPHLLKSDSPGHCRHTRRLEVDLDSRQVFCTLCGQALDACDVAWCWMNKEYALDSRVKKIDQFEEKERLRDEKAAERRRKKREVAG